MERKVSLYCLLHYKPAIRYAVNVLDQVLEGLVRSSSLNIPADALVPLPIHTFSIDYFLSTYLDFYFPWNDEHQNASSGPANKSPQPSSQTLKTIGLL